MNVTNVIETSKKWVIDSWNIASEKSKKLVNDGWDIASRNKKTIAVVVAGATAAIGIATLLYRQSSPAQLWNELSKNMNVIDTHIDKSLFGRVEIPGCKFPVNKELATAHINLSGLKSEMMAELFSQVKETFNQATFYGTNVLKNYTFDFMHTIEKSDEVSGFLRICSTN